MKEFFHTFTCLSNGWYDRCAQQDSELFDVEFVAALTKFIIHVEGNNHWHVHVYQLGGQIEVAFQVAGINHVDDEVGMLFDDVLAHIEFFRCIGCEGICARKVHDVKVVTFEIKMSGLGIDGHARVVSHTFVSTTGNIEEGCFSAVGIADENHTQFMSFQICHTLQDVFFPFCRDATLFGVLCHPCLRLFLIHNLYQFSLCTTQTDLVIHDFVLHGVVQGSIEQDLHALTLDESHLYNSFTKATVSHDTDNNSLLASL